MKTKICTICKQKLPIESFSWRNSQYKTTKNVCKACTNKQAAERTRKRVINRTNWNTSVDDLKVCMCCKEKKHLKSFSKNRRTLDGYQIHCKICQLKQRQQKAVQKHA